MGYKIKKRKKINCLRLCNNIRIVTEVCMENIIKLWDILFSTNYIWSERKWIFVITP